MSKNKSASGSFHVVSVPKHTTVERRADLIASSRMHSYWPQRYRPTVFEEDDVFCLNPIDGEEIVITRESALQSLIETFSHSHYASMSRDTWILDQHGDVVARIVFDVSVVYEDAYLSGRE